MPPAAPTRSIQSWSSRALSTRLFAFILALLLPPVASIFTYSSTTLQTIPFALYFISIAAVAILGGLAPALIAAASCAVWRAYFVSPGQPLITFDGPGLFRVGCLFGDAILISLLDRRRRAAANGQQRALRTLQDRSDALVESLHASHCASWVLDLSGPRPTAEWYSGSYHVFGSPFEELEDPQDITARVHPEDAPDTLTILAGMHTHGDPVLFDHRVLWPSGETRHLEFRATRVPGEKVCWRGITMDITERKQAEFALLRSEKLAAMGRLASTVAHEINNPLESVTNLLYLAHTDATLSPDTKSYLATAEQELARLGEITRLTLGFVRTSSVSQAVDVATIAEEVLSIFRRRLETRGIAIERHFQPGVELRIPGHELRQVLTNLISNSSDALNALGSRIAMHIRSDESGVTMDVADNGTGIGPAELNRIFDPFYTTKDDVGTGIGLWVTRELIERSGGTINAVSGDLPDAMHTRFTIHFPHPA